MEKLPSQMLESAKRRISLPQNWCKGEQARDRQGRAVPYFSARAEQFCMAGALFREGQGFSSAWPFLNRAVGYKGVGFVNDDSSTTHDDVLNIYDKAIALAKRSGK